MKTFVFVSSLFLLLSPSLNAQNSTLSTSNESTTISFPNEEMPEFPGGGMGMKKYLAENFIYPQAAKDSGYEGKCYLKFIVDTAGYTKDIQVLKGIKYCPDCDLEAVRLVKAMPRWKPGKRDGKPVEVRFNIPIEFKMR